VNEFKHCPAARVREQIVSVLTAWGMEHDIVATTAEVMIETDLAGVDSHGVSMLMDYESSRSKGKLNVKARPHIVKETPVMALIDADAGLGHPAAVMGMKVAFENPK
jgi:LDH2 family malate/lactate/ureidoglycolate dehydrogenase